MGLTPGALAFAVFCVLWTATTAFVACAVGSLYVRTRKQIDFISLLSYVVTLAMSASMAQQIYTIARWDQVKETERQDSILMAGKTKFFDVGSDKLVKALYYIQILCYNIGGTLIAFWCFFLWANVWPLKCYWWKSSIYSLATKSFAVIVACVLIGVSQLDYFSDKHLTRFLVGNMLLIIVLAVTPVFLALILYRYIYYRWINSKALLLGRGRKSWRLRHMNRIPKDVGQNTSTIESRSGEIPVDVDVAIELDNFPKELDSQASADLNQSNTFELEHRGRAIHQLRWRRKTFGTMLMLRFLGAIIVMSGLEIFHIFFQLSRVFSYNGSQAANDSIKEIPNTTMDQIADTYGFLPSTAQGWLVLLVFGTNENYWEKFTALIGGIFCCGFRTKCASGGRSSPPTSLSHNSGFGSAPQEQGRSTDNIVAVFGDIERGVSSSEEGQSNANSPTASHHQQYHNNSDTIEMTTPKPAVTRSDSERKLHRQSLPVSFQSLEIQNDTASSKHGRSNSLFGSRSSRSGTHSTSSKSPRIGYRAGNQLPDPWDHAGSATYTWRIER